MSKMTSKAAHLNSCCAAVVLVLFHECGFCSCCCRSSWISAFSFALVQFLSGWAQSGGEPETICGEAGCRPDHGEEMLHCWFGVWITSCCFSGTFYKKNLTRPDLMTDTWLYLSGRLKLRLSQWSVEDQNHGTMVTKFFCLICMISVVQVPVLISDVDRFSSSFMC